MLSSFSKIPEAVLLVPSYTVSIGIKCFTMKNTKTIRHVFWDKIKTIRPIFCTRISFLIHRCHHSTRALSLAKQGSALANSRMAANAYVWQYTARVT